MVTLYYVNDVFGVTVNVISDRSGFGCWNVYEVCPSDMYLQVTQFFRMGMSPGAGCVM